MTEQVSSSTSNYVQPLTTCLQQFKRDCRRFICLRQSGHTPFNQIILSHLLLGGNSLFSSRCDSTVALELFSRNSNILIMFDLKFSQNGENILRMRWSLLRQVKYKNRNMVCTIQLKKTAVNDTSMKCHKSSQQIGIVLNKNLPYIPGVGNL